MFNSGGENRTVSPNRHFGRRRINASRNSNLNYRKRRGRISASRNWSLSYRKRRRNVSFWAETLRRSSGNT